MVDLPATRSLYLIKGCRTHLRESSLLCGYVPDIRPFSQEQALLDDAWGFLYDLRYVLSLLEDMEYEEWMVRDE